MKTVSIVSVLACWAAVYSHASFVQNEGEALQDDQPERVVSHRIVVKHPGVDPDKPRPYSLSQALDARGQPVGYSMTVDSVICTDNLCKVVEVQVFWDALGVYERYALADGSILEKALIVDPEASPEGEALSAEPVEEKPVRTEDAWTAFTEADHAKLDRILRDRSSVLKTQRLDDLTGYRDKSRVDGMSGATPLTLKESVVEGAALSSYHLWHWANGGVVEAARKLTHQSRSEDLLRRFLVREEPHFVLFALEHLRLDQCFNPSLVPLVHEAMVTGSEEQIDLGLAYLKAALPDQDALNAELALLFQELDGRLYLLGVLDTEPKISGSLLAKLSHGLKNVDTYYELHLFLGLVEKQQQVSEVILTSVSRFLENENFFIARRAYRFLEKQPLNEPLSKQLAAFELECERKNRALH
ncbi:MAG: hypothetical protein ACPGES_11810 [Coraliomargarita sp.]